MPEWGDGVSAWAKEACSRGDHRELVIRIRKWCRPKGKLFGRFRRELRMKCYFCGRERELTPQERDHYDSFR